MRKIPPLLVLAALQFSCTQTTQDRITKAVTRHYSKHYFGNDKVESLNVDNVMYSLWDTAYYLDNLLLIELNYQKDLMGTVFTLQDPKYKRELDSVSSKIGFMNNLRRASSDTPIIYKAVYHVSYKTDRDSYDGLDSIYLYAPTLTFFSINVDSLMYKKG